MFLQAYAGFFYTNRAMQVQDQSDIDHFNASVNKFCETEWTQVGFTES